MKLHFSLLLVLLTACVHRAGSYLHATTPGTQQRSGQIILDLRTDKPSYKKGEAVQVTLTASQRCRVEITSVDAKGRADTIWPRRGNTASALEAGQTLCLPPAGADWKLTAADPKGTNTLVAKATSVPLPSTATSPASEHFQMHTGGWKGIAVESPQSEPSAPAIDHKSRGEARWLYEVR